MSGHQLLLLLTFLALLNQSLSECIFPNETLQNVRIMYENPSHVNLTEAPELYVLRFRCRKGFQLMGPRGIICVNKKWTSETPKCVKLHCHSPPSIDNGYFKLRKGINENAVVGSIANYSCNEGYEISDKRDTFLTCIFNGATAVWVGEMPTCQEKTSCLDPGISPDGKRNGTCCSAGDILNFSCKSGFDLVGEKSIKCLPGGIWSASRPKCRPRQGYCPDPPLIPNGRIEGTNRGDYYTPEDEVEIICNPGYAFKGQTDFVLCEDTFLWQAEFGECEEAFCTVPDNPENGSILELENANLTQVPYQFELTYICNPKFRLVGESLRICKGNGWSGKEPYCESITCPNPGTPENGMRHGNDFSIGEKVVFNCFSGFTLLGSAERYCLPNGQWSGELTRCNADDNFCSDPGVPINGMKIGNRYKEGEKVLFYCLTGFTLIGSKERECLPNRTWSGAEVKCIGPYDYDSTEKVGEILKTVILEKSKEQAEELSKIEAFSNDTRLMQERALDINFPGRLIFYFIFDVSGSVGIHNFNISIKFAKTLVKKVGISKNGARAGALTFSSDAEVQFFPTTYFTTEEVLAALDRIRYTSGGTATNSALQTVKEDMLPITRELVGTKGVKSVIFILTDGKANTGGNPEIQAKELKDAHVEIFCIGITGDPRKDALYKIASEPLEEHVFVLKDYKSLEWLVQEITNGTIDYSKCGVGLEKVDKLKPRARIIGGQKVVEPWPWMAALYFAVLDDNRNPVDFELLCGGSIIGQRWILTAAHCLYSKKEKILRKREDVNIKLGLTDRGNFTSLQEFEAENLFIHPEYNPQGNMDYDIAIIQLNRLIDFTPYVRPVCLPQSELPENTKLYQSYENAYAAGWGYDKKVRLGETIRVKALKNLKELRLPIQPRGRCKQSLKNLGGDEKLFTPRMFCAGSGEGDEDTCEGDSGGPLMQLQMDSESNVFWTQIGIISWGPGCGQKNSFGFYTHVHKLLPWINSIIQNEKSE